MIRIDGPTPGSFSAVTDLPAGQSVHMIVDVSGYFAVAQGQGIARGGGMEPAAVGGVRFYTLRDEEHRLSTEYQQDASIGTRVAKDYFYFGNRLVATNTAWGAAQGWHFYTTDHLGTPRLKTDIAGTVVARPKYRPFGERIGETPEQGPELAGMERDTVSGDYYVHARYQRSSLGRFNALDEVLGAPEAPASWNRYAYARNSPLKYVDPDGRADVPATALLGRGAPEAAARAMQDIRGVPIANVLLRRDLGAKAPLATTGEGTFGIGDRVGIKLDLLRSVVSLSQSGGVGIGPNENRLISFAEKMSINLGTGEVSQARGAQISVGLVTAESFDNGEATVTIQAKKYLGFQFGANIDKLKSAIGSYGETVMAVFGNLLEEAGVTPGTAGGLSTRPVCADPIQGGCK